MAVRFKACSVDGCNANAHRDAAGKRGYCSKHYQRLRSHGDPTKTVVAEPGSPMRFIAELVGEGRWPADCIEWPFGKKEGYGVLKVNGKSKGAHREICERVHGAPPSSSHEACHSCGRGIFGCINPGHVYWGTHQQNMADAVVHGSRRVPKGNELFWAKLDEQKVRDIRLRATSGTSQQSIADAYGVAQATVSAIVRRKKWAWVQ